MNIYSVCKTKVVGKHSSCPCWVEEQVPIGVDVVIRAYYKCPFFLVVERFTQIIRPTPVRSEARVVCTPAFSKFGGKGGVLRNNKCIAPAASMLKHDVGVVQWLRFGASTAPLPAERDALSEKRLNPRIAVEAAFCLSHTCGACTVCHMSGLNCPFFRAFPEGAQRGICILAVVASIARSSVEMCVAQPTRHRAGPWVFYLHG